MFCFVRRFCESQNLNKKIAESNKNHAKILRILHIFAESTLKLSADSAKNR
ncbi:hypothetical protein ACWIUD_05175 [Helicobacter sp. 23-1044]